MQITKIKIQYMYFTKKKLVSLNKAKKKMTH